MSVYTSWYGVIIRLFFFIQTKHCLLTGINYSIIMDCGNPGSLSMIHTLQVSILHLITSIRTPCFPPGRKYGKHKWIVLSTLRFLSCILFPVYTLTASNKLTVVNLPLSWDYRSGENTKKLSFSAFSNCVQVTICWFIVSKSCLM